MPDGFFYARAVLFPEKIRYLCMTITVLQDHCYTMGTTGFDSRQSLTVSTPSVVRRLVKMNVHTTNGNNSYALAA